MSRLIAIRCATAVVTLLVISAIVFAMVEMLPGDVATLVLGRFAAPAAVEEFRRQLNLDQPVVWRYLIWLGGLVTGDLGKALSNGRPIAQIIASPLRNTLILSGAALAIYLPLTIGVALVQASRRDRPVDHALSLATVVAASTPEFLLSLLLLVFFVVVFPILPAVSFVDAQTSLLGWIRALLLPATVLAIVISVYGIRMLRDSVIGILDSDFVQAALLRGLSPRRVLLRHALPNALVPALNVTALNLTYLIGGVVIVEKVFGFPGFGTLMIDAISFRDVPLVEATVMIAATVYVAANLVVDVLSLLLNPKLRRAA